MEGKGEGEVTVRLVTGSEIQVEIEFCQRMGRVLRGIESEVDRPDISLDGKFHRISRRSKMFGVEVTSSRSLVTRR